MIEILLKLQKEGTLKKLVDAGFLSTKVLLYYNIYLEVDKQKRLTKKKVVDIVSEVGEVFGVKEITVYRALKCFKQ